jgi:hypothetical protein
MIPDFIQSSIFVAIIWVVLLFGPILICATLFPDWNPPGDVAEGMGVLLLFISIFGAVAIQMFLEVITNKYRRLHEYKKSHYRYVLDFRKEKAQ